MVAALEGQIDRGDDLIGGLTVLDGAVDNGIVEDQGLCRGRVAGLAVTEDIVAVRAGDLGLGEEQIVVLYGTALDNDVFRVSIIGRIYNDIYPFTGVERDSVAAGH